MSQLLDSIKHEIEMGPLAAIQTYDILISQLRQAITQHKICKSVEKAPFLVDEDISAARAAKAALDVSIDRFKQLGVLGAQLPELKG